ncbi:hypothetical protein F511_24337, partial [Dorcoceras hygrometricum]
QRELQRRLEQMELGCAQVNAFTREQAEETPSRVIGGTCFVFDFPARWFFDNGCIAFVYF